MCNQVGQNLNSLYFFAYILGQLSSFLPVQLPIKENKINMQFLASFSYFLLQYNLYLENDQRNVGWTAYSNLDGWNWYYISYWNVLKSTNKQTRDRFGPNIAESAIIAFISPCCQRVRITFAFKQVGGGGCLYCRDEISINKRWPGGSFVASSLKY